MRNQSNDQPIPDSVLLGLAITGLVVGGYQLYRSSTPRGRIALTVGMAAGIGGLFWARQMVASRRAKSVTAGPVTQSTVLTPHIPIGTPGENEEDRLDEAIDESFPASDPVSVRIE